jgi:gliding motility-associated-like protein
MKTLLLFLSIIFITYTFAQCPNDNTFSLNATPPCPGTQTVSNVSGGTSYTVDVITGNTYTFSTCGNTAFDTQITVYNGGTVIGYNDDACGLQSEVTWTATFTGTITVLVDQFNCQNTGTGAQLVIECTLPIQTGDGCNTDITICTPGVAGPFGFSTPGNPVGSCLDWIGLTYAYIILYITESGPLQLLIDGDATTGFLDVAIFNIQDGQNPCVAIENPANQISCNYATNPGGCNQIGNYFPCNSSVPSPNVSAGDVLMIVIENWSNASNTFTMQLGPPPAAQTGPPNPNITPVGPFCSTDPSIQLTAVDMGGTWTGPGVNADGVFNPATAGIGTHTINYSIGSGPCEATSNTTITVNNCTLPCIVTSLNASIGSCQVDNTFPVSGTFTYDNNPGTGTVIVAVTNASGTQTQTFNPPFVNGQTYNFNITTNTSDGSPLTVTVYFSDNTACTLSVNSTSPQACGCLVDIGTFTATITGNSPNNYVLCFGDEIDIVANGDYTPPGEATNPPNAGGYEPGITWLVYSCPPTVGVTPSNTPPNDWIGNDPCLIGLYSDFDLYDINDQYWMTAFPPGTFTNNTVYFVPITMYNLTENLYSHVNTDLPCYEMGIPYAVQYLPQITFTQSQTCTNVNATITGGLPAVNGSQFTAVAGSLTPANATFVNTTANNGGAIAITGLTAGQGYSFQVQDANGCPITVTGTFVGPPTLTYPQTAYCPVGTASPAITGTAGGTYSSTAGLSINPSTGIINLAASTPGNYTVTYTTPAVPGPACSATFDLTVHPLPLIVANDVTVCQGGSVTVSASGATTYSWSPGTFLSATTGSSVTFSNGTTTTYTVTGTDANGCINTDPVTVTVNGNAPVNAGLDATICSGASTTLIATGALTYNWDNSLGAGASHTVSPTVTTTYTVTGTDVNGCLGTDAVTVTVNPNPNPVITGPSTYCAGNPAVLSTTQTYSTYTWSTGSTSATTTATSADNPITVQVTNSFGCTGTSPAFNVNENPVIIYNSSVTICQGGSAIIHGIVQTTGGLYSETFTTPSGCDSVANITLIVNPLPPVNAGADQTVCFGSSVTLSAFGAAIYNWSGGVQNNVPFIPQSTMEYTVTGTDVNGCINSDVVMVTVNSIPVINAGSDQSVCQGTSVTLEGAGGAGYSWSGGISNGVPFVPSVGTNTYTVTGTSPEGCTSTDQVVVVVNPTPAVFAGNDVVVCEGQTVTLTGSGAATYTWDNGINNGVAFVPTLGTTTYTVTGTSSAGCINTDQVNVIVNPNPGVSFLPGATLGCAPFTTSLTNTSTESANCTWTFSNGTTLTGCGTVPVTFTQAGCYDVTLTTTSLSGCTSSFTANNIICVEAPPNASFAPSANQVSNLNTQINFTNTTTGASNYIWSFGDQSQTSTEINPSHVYPTEPVGQYEVMLIAFSPFGCTDTAYSTIQIYEELIFYVPNTFTPDNDKFNPVFLPVFTAGFDPYDYKLLIFNRWGEIIFESNNAEIGWDGSYGKNAEIGMCQDGVYTWKIEFKVTRWDERRIAIGHVNLIR